jgi:hypothetical protein
MESRKSTATDPLVPHLLRIDRGEKIMESLLGYVRANTIKSGFLTGIGATMKAEIGWFDTQAQVYRTRVFEEPCEITTMIGNIAWHEGDPIAHTHITLGREDFSVVGGHLIEATVGVTCEIWLLESDMDIYRNPSSIGNLKLIDFKSK